ncbi:amino acid/amide ABC transporter membrane protein 1, HAAT family (TC 3.A.1.4.-) [Tessaracoccus bendigoensis DSM 12906]|uniref:Amino acid/amide ABC transporter membrane protein 1, HAAT family (TC 3.A.1.4.-) n=1 Tax=Tessaracoccus bendigoensis DSM 12906 TaxID=1123357 RepID=A0A1M6F145_9ACTN|nr:branched-chain amino acid ABC transporter permease [Tessaracoccus bendigoensis]SHI91400.1 amino acid/amide ABC transporter membrane protein 1, HAAT family (TC 3.A.1.4.-) [Tessaracoccus bendigoensis DSM 12906]
MTEFLQQLINSLSLGSIYALIALGYTMVYGIIKLINFAHGDVYMVGAYVGYASMSILRLGFFESLILAMLVCTVLGVVIERVAYRPLRNSTRIAALITAIGVSLLIEYTMMFFVGADPRAYPAMPAFMNGSVNLGGVIIKNQQMLIIGVSVALMILLQFIVKKTKMGKAMRAVSQDPDAAQLMGISVDRTISFTFAIGSALAGAAGVLVGVYYNSINPLMGIIPGLKAFVAAVFGGIGIIPGALIGGYVIGGAETLVSSLGFSLFKDGVVFAILILILIVKPAGLLGKNRKEKV